MRPRALGPMLPRSIIETAARRFGDDEALYCAATGRRLTFRDLDARANRLAQALLSSGHRKGSVVGFLCSNRAEMVDIYFALAKTGIVGVPLNYRLAPPEVAELLRVTDARTLIIEDRFAALAKGALATLPGLRQCIWIGENHPAGGIDYQHLLSAAEPTAPVVSLDEWDPYYFNLTSGTTGLPKCYAITHFNAAAITLMGNLYEVRSSDVLLTTLPAFGRIGMAWLVIGLLAGARNVLMNFDADSALRLIETEAVTITNIVPTMGAMLLASPELARRSMSSLRAIIYAGSMLPAQLRTATGERICAEVHEYYGMQETGVLAASGPRERRLRPDSVGRAPLFTGLRIIGPDGSPVAPGEIGEILGTSPAATTSYFKNDAATEGTFRDGWVHTGDLGRLDAEGFLFICGRKKDMIVTGGQNVFAAEVEAVLLDLPGVRDCAVFGLPDATWGECVAAAVVADASADLDLTRVQEHCRRVLAGFKLPRRLFLQADPLPRTPTGKVQKFLLVERHGTPLPNVE